MRPSIVTFSGAVEGPTDEAILRRIVEYKGGRLETVYGKQGKNALLTALPGYNHAARFHPWIVVLDLDHSAECAATAKTQWLPQPSQHMLFRIAVRKVESWLLADRETLARFLGIASSRAPVLVETLDDPKLMMVTLARGSRRRDIRLDMVPREGSGRSEGPAYTSRLIEYAQSHWRPEIAAQHADSLKRLVRHVSRYTGESQA